MRAEARAAAWFLALLSPVPRPDTGLEAGFPEAPVFSLSRKSVSVRTLGHPMKNSLTWLWLHLLKAWCLQDCRGGFMDSDDPSFVLAFDRLNQKRSEPLKDIPVALLLELCP